MVSTGLSLDWEYWTGGVPTILRTDWLERYGLELPKSVAELENILRVFKERDPAGGGTTIPLDITYRGAYAGLAGAFMEGASHNFVAADGTLKVWEYKPGFEELLTTLNRWYEAGYINKEAFTMSTEQNRELQKANRVGASIYWYSKLAAIAADITKVVPEASWTFAEVEGWQHMRKVRPDFKGWAITKKSENPAAAMRYLNYPFTNDGANLYVVSAGVPGIHWEEVSLETVEKEDPWYAQTARRTGRYGIGPNI